MDEPGKRPCPLVPARRHFEGDGAEQIDWDRFLFLCTQEYRKARPPAGFEVTRGGMWSDTESYGPFWGYYKLMNPVQGG